MCLPPLLIEHFLDFIIIIYYRNTRPVAEMFGIEYDQIASMRATHECGGIWW